MTATISKEDVFQLARLAQIQLADEEVLQLQNDLSNILEYINKLMELDTSEVEPTYQVTELENIFREDTVQASSVSREKLIALAPDKAEHQIKVPKVL